MAVTYFLLLPLLVFSFTKINDKLESLIFDNIELDRHNDFTCKHPSIKEHVYLWYNNEDACLKKDPAEYVYAHSVNYNE